MNEIDCVQGEQAWFECRLCCVTSSRVADAIAVLKRKEGESAARRNLRYEFLAEHLTKKTSEHFVSKWMEEGTEKEPLARMEYEMLREVSVREVGFVYHPEIKMAGCSPDGCIGEDGLIEIKCPKIETHLQYLLNDVIPSDYQAQMLWQMACCERQWVDFVSYHPDVPQPYQLFIKRLERTAENDAIIRGMELEVTQFLKEVDVMIADLEARKVPQSMVMA